MAKIKRTWARMNREQRIQFAQQVKGSLTGNANVPTPKPTLVDLQALIDDAIMKRSAVSTLETALKAARLNDADGQDALIAGLDTESSTVESATDGDPAKIATTGFESTTSTPSASAPMAQVHNFSLTAGDNEAELDGQCDPVPNAQSYEIQTGTNPNDPAGWVTKLTVTKTSFTLTGLTSGQRIWGRGRAIGAMGPGPWSDPATKIVP